MAGDLAMGGNAITGASALSDFLLRDGTNAMAGNLDMGSNNITSTGVNSSFLLRSGTNAMSGDLDMDGNDVKNIDKFYGSDLNNSGVTIIEVEADRIDMKDNIIENVKILESTYLSGTDGLKINVVDKLEFMGDIYYGSSNSITVPFSLHSTLSSTVQYLNADRVDDKEATDFLLRDGTQDMTDDLDMGGKDITNTGKVWIGNNSYFIEGQDTFGETEVKLYINNTEAGQWS